MTVEELNLICQEGENYLIEFKKKVNASFSRELTAFANASGGRIFVGIDDNGNITGIDDSNKLRSQIQDIALNCDPAISVEIKSFHSVLEVTVKEGRDKPY